MLSLLCLFLGLHSHHAYGATVSAGETFQNGNGSAEETYDVVIYGGTSAAVVAAVQVAKMGKKPVIVCPDKHLGGLTSSGLGWVDSGNRSAIGGLSREFFARVWEHYQQADAWRWQSKESFGNRSQGAPGKDGDKNTMWVFEPHVAESIFDHWVEEFGIEVYREEWLDRDSGVVLDGKKIQAIKTLSGKTFSGKVFIDATYEGDLMATTGVSYHVGRESNRVYGESWNGIQVGVLHHNHHFQIPIDPYVVPGDPQSGVLPRISTADPGQKGDGDKRIQAYCFRMCMTKHEENRIPFPKPDGYDPAQYELLLRVLTANPKTVIMKPDPVPNFKTDTNNNGPFSTDNIGFNYDYPEASYERRREIIAEHEQYQKGLLYFLANDSRVPETVRREVSSWGLAKDEFKDNGGWPHQIYVREARRLIGEYVMTEQDCLDQRVTPDSIGMGSYTMDSHNVQRYIKPDGKVQNEGDIGVHPARPYEIAWGSVLPKQDECENLLVPVCVSSSHIAYGSIRMEPVFMILGQSAATGACMAIERNIDLHDLAYDDLREQLIKDGQVLEIEVQPVIGEERLTGIVVDDEKAVFVGHWVRSSSTKPFVGFGYRHDENQEQGEKSARFETELKPGKYRVRIHYPAFDNRTSKANVRIEHAEGLLNTAIDMTKISPAQADRDSNSIGNYWESEILELGETSSVTISNEDANGFVVVDAVQWIPVK